MIPYDNKLPISTRVVVLFQITVSSIFGRDLLVAGLYPATSPSVGIVGIPGHSFLILTVKEGLQRSSHIYYDFVCE